MKNLFAFINNYGTVLANFADDAVYGVAELMKDANRILPRFMTFENIVYTTMFIFLVSLLIFYYKKSSLFHL